MNLEILWVSLVLTVGLACLDWRRAVKAALVLVIIEGGIRKWVLPEASDTIYFLKDIVLLGAYVGYLLDREREPARGLPDLRTILIVSATFVVLQAFSMRMNSVIVGIFGIKVYLWYVPLCFMLPSLFRSCNELEIWLRRYLLLALPVCLLGFAQFVSPPSSLLNTYVATGDGVPIATFGIHGNPRITGTFSYISGHATYLFVSLVFVIALLTVRQSRIWRVLLVGIVVLIVGNTFMTGSRGPVLADALFLIGFLWFSGAARSLHMRSSFTPILVAGALCLAASIYWFDDALTAFVERATTSDNLTERIVDNSLEPLRVLYEEDVFGFGTGSTHPGGSALRNRLNLTDADVAPPPAELEPVRVFFELGLLGFVAWYSLRLYLIWALWRTWKHLSSRRLRNLALAAFLVHAIQISGSLVLNQTFGIYYWLTAGFVFLLPKLDANTRLSTIRETATQAEITSVS